MARKKNLTVADKFYLDSHINNDVEELSEAVNVDVATITEYVEARKPGLAQDADRLFGKKERNGVVVATVSTEGASSVADSNRKSTANTQNPNMIFRPRGPRG